MTARLAKIAVFAVGFVAWFALTGCANYHLGTQGKLAFQSVFIEPIDDAANVPQATPLISTQLREAFLRDGRVQLVSSPELADATLKVSLQRYNRAVATVLPNDTARARKFDVTLEATCTLRDRRTGALIFENRPVTAYRQVFTGDDPAALPPGAPYISNQRQAEYQALPLLASTLADRVTHTTLDVW
jgi:hypothetical protein